MKLIVRHARTIKKVLLNVVAVLAFIVCVSSTSVHADTSDVQAQIDANNQQISSIQKDIAAYQKQLTALGSQKQTLKSSISSLDVSRQKTTAQISLTQAQIDAANLNIQKLSAQIQTKEAQLDVDKQTLAASIRQINNGDNTSLVTSMFSSSSLEDLWNDIDTQTQLTEALKAHADSLSSDKVQLSSQQGQVTSTKDHLTDLSTNLQTQEGQLDATKKSKQTLLAQTSSKESTYQTLLATKKAQQKQFENQLSELENQLKNVAPSAIPHTGQGILAWPFSASVEQSCVGKQGALGNPYCITQYFGNTAFATANAAIYSGMGHDGIDIGVPIGTPVQAALTGFVAGTGNTDLTKGCYSFGQWVMIKHADGLNTMYAHLSQIKVVKGQAVSTGDVIGYSGMTGYATGPHLHFGVYATAGVQYLTLNQFRGSTTGCANATMPVAPKDAYLNPLSYL